jgi:hypothetical protein
LVVRCKPHDLTEQQPYNVVTRYPGFISVRNSASVKVAITAQMVHEPTKIAKTP